MEMLPDQGLKFYSGVREEGVLSVFVRWDYCDQLDLGVAGL